AMEKGISASALVIAWMLHSVRFSDRPMIIPLFSSSGLPHLLENIKASEISLDSAEVAVLNEA
ncbi:MAG: hypothetical protein FWD23_16375, partial [Oscillospiraceae bacterium]|nr:hypothetical protein [Oscillospiraceae bacterium]